MDIDEIAPRMAPKPAGDRAAPRQSRSSTVLVLHARALSRTGFRASATTLATELALLLRCERVSIGFRRHDRVHVDAMSNTADIAARRNIVRAIAAAMDEAIDQRLTVVHPLPPGASPSALLAHAELARQNGQASICSVPIVVGERAVGALLCEQRGGFDARAIEVAKDIATFVGPVLALKHRLDQPLGRRLLDAFSPPDRGERQRGLGARHVGAVAAALALAAVALWPTTFRVIATARVEGAGQRVIAAPVDGFVQSAALRPGATVREGQVLATLDQQDLALEREKWNAEIGQLDKAYRDAMSKDDAAQIAIARSKLEQAQAQLELVMRQLDRAQLKAPFDGVLLSGDLTQSIGAPVRRGQELMTVAPDRSFRVVAEVDEQDIGALRDGQRAQVLLAALAERPVPVVVTRIAPVATQIDGRNVFEVDGRIEGKTDALSPGLRGVARIEIERATLGSVWSHRAGQWLRRTWWRVLG